MLINLSHLSEALRANFRLDALRVLPLFLSGPDRDLMREIVIDTETTGLDPFYGPSIMTMTAALAER